MIGIVSAPTPIDVLYHRSSLPSSPLFVLQDSSDRAPLCFSCCAFFWRQIRFCFSFPAVLMHIFFSFSYMLTFCFSLFWSLCYCPFFFWVKEFWLLLAVIDVFLVSHGCLFGVFDVLMNFCFSSDACLLFVSQCFSFLTNFSRFVFVFFLIFPLAMWSTKKHPTAKFLSLCFFMHVYACFVADSSIIMNWSENVIMCFNELIFAGSEFYFIYRLFFFQLMKLQVHRSVRCGRSILTIPLYLSSSNPLLENKACIVPLLNTISGSQDQCHNREK